MVLDIITAALIVIPMGLGMARGFLYITMRLLGWVGALAAGFFAAPQLRQILEDSPLGIRVHDMVSAQFGGAAEGVGDQTAQLPSILGDTIDQAAQNTAELMTQAVEGVILTILGFVMVAIGIRLLLILVIRPISRRRGRGPVALLNKLAGLIVGSAEGLLLAFLFLAALIPAMNLVSGDTAASISDALKFSYLAGNLYDGNLLLAMF